MTALKHAAAPRSINFPERKDNMTTIQPTDESVVETIHKLIDQFGGEINSFEGDLLKQQIQTTLKMILEGHRTDQLKLITRSLKEMRYAYRIFNESPKVPRVSIFGSARTPKDHPDYAAAEKFSIALAEKGWISITGGGSGIMRAGLSGIASGGNFGLSIRLPFESTAQADLPQNSKLIQFRYFFTRKLMFMAHANAFAIFPGGYGTMDELFETLTLMQTGRSSIVPVVLLEREGGRYWQCWEHYTEENLLRNGWISPEDKHLYYIASDPADAVHHIERFYHRYHSSRYVGDEIVIRLKSPLTEEQTEELHREFEKLVATGKMRLSAALSEENDSTDLQRIVFHHTRRDFGILRLLIDRINSL